MIRENTTRNIVVNEQDTIQNNNKVYRYRRKTLPKNVPNRL